MRIVSDAVGTLSAAAAAMIAVAAAAACAALIVLLYPWLERHALAKPNARSSHFTPTPQGGGIAIVARPNRVGRAQQRLITLRMSL